MFADLNKTTSAFDPVLRFCQVFGFVAFIGGFLLTLWNLKAVWTGKRRWPAKLWSVVLVFVHVHRALGRVRVPSDRLGSELLMAQLKLDVAVEKLRLAAPFRISGYVFEEQDAVVVTLSDGAHRGRGEASGVYYLGDNAPQMVAAIEGAAQPRSKPASTAPGCSSCCRPAARATRSTARCGISTRTAPARRSGNWPACRRRSR